MIRPHTQGVFSRSDIQAVGTSSQLCKDHTRKMMTSRNSARFLAVLFARAIQLLGSQLGTGDCREYRGGSGSRGVDSTRNGRRPSTISDSTERGL